MTDSKWHLWQSRMTVLPLSRRPGAEGHLARSLDLGTRPRPATPLDAQWESQLAGLAAYKATHGDCRVPKRWAEDPGLANWVRTQRKCKKALDRGEACEGMTAERAAKLDALGFAWAAGHGGDHQPLDPAPEPKQRGRSPGSAPATDKRPRLARTAEAAASVSG